ncbi:hypothetical protein ADK52_33160 [Streptomyces sp. WM6372]|uniref:DUF4386 domain-containing protein n=1 Tax=Streptomyces sp. WM6372 TaxID=1415555 RepID=UPI0006B0460E|nr:DUF4386 domain-containing protein [Streptomyces sp. WM6372]KOU16643.1 hypothetical protein ADK52_33160 [Streptomyces sp. WM6372]
MGSNRKTALVTGVLFLVTEVAAIGGLALYGPVLHDAGYVLGPGADARVFLGALSEFVLALAVIGTGVALYPVVKRQNEGAALGYVCGRLLEAAVILVGTISVLSVVTLRRESAAAPGEGGASLLTAADTLVAVHDWTFLIGPNFVLGANTLVLAGLMYRSRLVPRPLAVLGLVGGALICASATAVLFGVYEQVSVAGSLAALPVFAWEVGLAVRLLAKGFTGAGGTGTETGAGGPAAPAQLPNTAEKWAASPETVGGHSLAPR